MKRFACLACIFLILARVSCAGATPEEKEKFRSDLDEGISILRNGSRSDLPRAVAKFKAALKIMPESAETYYWLALAHSDMHNYPSAAAYAKESVTYDERLADAWLLWGQVLLYTREWNEALGKLESAAKLAPDNPMVQFNLGLVHYHGFKNPDTALAKFRQAWQIGLGMRRDKPELIAMAVRARLYMGCCEYDRGLRQNHRANFENAVKAFQDVIREQPNNLDAHFRLALALRGAGRPGDSENILRGLLKIYEESREPVDRNMLAEVHLQLADLYIKNQEQIMPIYHLQEFVRLIGDSNHQALEAVREYLTANDMTGGA